MILKGNNSEAFFRKDICKSLHIKNRYKDYPEDFWKEPRCLFLKRIMPEDFHYPNVTMLESFQKISSAGDVTIYIQSNVIGWWQASPTIGRK